jgi:hypothetical protein
VDLEVGNPLANWRALLWFLRPWRQRLIAAQGSSEAAGEKVDRLCAWVARCLWIALVQRKQIGRVREQLGQGLDLDPEIVRLALTSDFPRFRVEVKHGPRRLVIRRKPMLLASHYCRVWQNLETWRLVHKEAPLLLPVLTATYLAGAEVSGDRVLQRVKTKFLEARGTNRAWKCLAQKGIDPIGVPSAVPVGANPLETIALLACAYVDLDLDRRCCSARVVEALLSFVTIELEDRIFLRHRLSRISAFLRIALPEASARAVRGELRDFLLGDFLDMASIWSHITANAGGELKLGTWATLQDAGRDPRLLVAEPEHESWRSAIPRWDYGSLAFIALTSAIALAQEGLWHNHCVSAYGWRCAKGSTQIFSIRDRTTGFRIATLRLERNGFRWSVGQVAGTSNAPVPKWIRDAAEQLASRYTRTYAQGIPWRLVDWITASARKEGAAFWQRVVGTAGDLSQLHRRWTRRARRKVFAGKTQLHDYP